MFCAHQGPVKEEGVGSRHPVGSPLVGPDPVWGAAAPPAGCEEPGAGRLGRPGPHSGARITPPDPVTPTPHPGVAAWAVRLSRGGQREGRSLFPGCVGGVLLESDL